MPWSSHVSYNPVLGFGDNIGHATQSSIDHQNRNYHESFLGFFHLKLTKKKSIHFCLNFEISVIPASCVCSQVTHTNHFSMSTSSFLVCPPLRGAPPTPSCKVVPPSLMKSVVFVSPFVLSCNPGDAPPTSKISH